MNNPLHIKLHIFFYKSWFENLIWKSINQKSIFFIWEKHSWKRPLIKMMKEKFFHLKIIFKLTCFYRSFSNKISLKFNTRNLLNVWPSESARNEMSKNIWISWRRKSINQSMNQSMVTLTRTNKHKQSCWWYIITSMWKNVDEDNVWTLLWRHVCYKSIIVYM